MCLLRARQAESVKWHSDVRLSWGAPFPGGRSCLVQMKKSLEAPSSGAHLVLCRLAKDAFWLLQL